MNKHSLLIAAGVLALTGAVASEAHADRRLNSLRNDPAVRHRKLMVKNRFELTPLFESTINASFRHIIGGGLKLEYHIGDMLSIGAVGVGSTALDTSLVKKIRPTLEDMENSSTREPSEAEFMNRLNKMPLHGAGYISITPWYGKLAAFGQAFVAFDFYFQAGIAYAQVKSDCPTSVCSDANPGMSRPNPMEGGEPLPPDNNPNNDPPLNDGTRWGLYLGGGIHVFLNDFLALDLTVRDYAFTDNPSGADFNADLAVTTDDNRFLHHLFFGAGISVMFPMTAKRTP
ncbi:MAG: hypothetical protein AB7P03_14740 [Kofleriaceae bacterium]